LQTQENSAALSGDHESTHIQNANSEENPVTETIENLTAQT
jgi:hypothetical protein